MPRRNRMLSKRETGELEVDKVSVAFSADYRSSRFILRCHVSHTISSPAGTVPHSFSAESSKAASKTVGRPPGLPAGVSQQNRFDSLRRLIAVPAPWSSLTVLLILPDDLLQLVTDTDIAVILVFRDFLTEPLRFSLIASGRWVSHTCAQKAVPSAEASRRRWRASCC